MVSMQNDRNTLNSTFIRDKPLKLDTHVRLLNVCWILREREETQKITWLSKPFPGILLDAQKASNVFQVQSDI